MFVGRFDCLACRRNVCRYECMNVCMSALMCECVYVHTRFRFDRVVAYVLLVFGALLVPVCVVLWVLGVVCDSMKPGDVAEFCYTLGLLTANTTADGGNTTTAAAAFLL
jgi:hypothetical protein